MKSLEFGAWPPVKSLDYNGFYLPFAKFFFLLIRFVMFSNRCLSTRLGCQLQVVSTRSNYNPVIISPVWFDYKSLVLYMVNPVFITTRHGFIINRHNMEGVISTQDWGYHLYYKKVGKTNNVIQCHRYDIFHI